MRGNLELRALIEARLGSIPARAGEPFRFGLSSLTLRVYPRACGGTGSYKKLAPLVKGLSPRVRGNRQTGIA